MDIKCRLVVVGGGLAGFSAALEASELGADVMLLEKQDSTGGSTVISSGTFALAGTDLQRTHGIEDSDALLFRDLREVGEFENDEAIVNVYVQNQLETYEWLRAHGVEFSPFVEALSGQSVPRVHKVEPTDMLRVLAERCRESGRVRVITSSPARRLVRDERSGRVEAVLATKDGIGFKVTGTDGIVLTSGGFCRNRELVHRFVPEYDKAVFVSGDGNVGDGLKMAWRLGADFRDMAFVKGSYGKHPVDTTIDVPCLPIYRGAIAVNRVGKRYVNESLSYKLLGDACMRQAGGCTYQIFDQDIFETGENRVRTLAFERRLEAGLLLKESSLEVLADRIEVPRSALIETVDRYNKFVTSGFDEDFGRKCLVHNHGRIRAIARAPFYAYPSTAAVVGTYCGLCVDSGMRVIDVFGERIDGLYAAGEIVGGLHGAAYMTGSSLAKAAIFGRIAARTAIASHGGGA